jgi:hypothetical protein
MEQNDRIPQEDERGSKPPADDGEDEEGSHGPLGNPASDEEALSHKQQERDAPSDD